MLYLLNTTETFLINKEKNKIIKENNIDEINVSEYDLEETSIKDIIDDCSIYSLFNDKKVVIVNNSYLFTSKKSKEEDLKLLEDYLNNYNPDTLLIFVVKDKLDERKKITKLIRKVGKVLELDIKDIKSIVKEMFEPYKIDNSLITLFIDRVGNDLTLINNEINKIKIYKDKDLEITSDDIISLTNENIEANIFLLIDSIINKNKKEALLIYNKLIDLNEEPIAIIIALANKIRSIYQTKELYRKGYKESDIANILGVKPGYLYYLRDSLSKYDSYKLYNLLEQLADLDYGIKKGTLSKKQALELFIIEN